MASTTSKLAVGIVVLAVAVWFAHDKWHDSQVASAHEKQRLRQKRQYQEAVIAASKQFGAILGWEEQFTSRSSDPFSLQLEQALAPNGGKPIVFDGIVEDVARHGEKYYLQLDEWSVGRFSIRFILECDLAVAKEIIEKKESFSDISVIAQIESVEKAQFSVKSGIKTTEDAAPVEIDSSSVFIAHGRCLQVMSKE